MSFSTISKNNLDRTTSTPATSSSLTEHPVTVLLIDDQRMIGEAVRRMLVGESDIHFHYCEDPTQAIKIATEIHPTVILQDLVMPQIDGLTLVRYFRANAGTRDIPMIVLSTKEEAKVKAEAFAHGANDYLVKLPDKLELVARIRYHSRGYINLLQRNEAYQALIDSQRALAAELAQAAEYVKSLLPEPLTGEVETEWRFIPSTQLGGDSFGYHWLDPDHFAIYLLDVCGHGVHAALLSISVMNVLRSQTLPNTDFYNPSDVLKSLNETFQMEDHNNMYFTIWYGVYDRTRRSIAYSSGGHPPAVLLTGPAAEACKIAQLKTPGMVIGGLPGTTFENASCDVEAFGKLFVFSDGVYEITRPDGTLLQYNEFVQILTAPLQPGTSEIERTLCTLREIQGSGNFEDDFSIVRVLFD